LQEVFIQKISKRNTSLLYINGEEFLTYKFPLHLQPIFQTLLA